MATQQVAFWHLVPCLKGSGALQKAKRKWWGFVEIKYGPGLPRAYSEMCAAVWIRRTTNPEGSTQHTVLFTLCFPTLDNSRVWYSLRKQGPWFFGMGTQIQYWIWDPAPQAAGRKPGGGWGRGGLLLQSSLQDSFEPFMTPFMLVRPVTVAACPIPDFHTRGKGLHVFDLVIPKMD